ncbi:hypothetical protein B4U80_14496 [Leptotrombidium deliense]|uniref:RING-type domain-containing protein n=1 Tax=Leptotrombidium deliense TaxID=299467 RepID=A0A443RVS5_9ACAR|nr:hypothetical protein B4U80_14496 [Leptotrombidium deliense]
MSSNSNNKCNVWTTLVPFQYLPDATLHNLEKEKTTASKSSLLLSHGIHCSICLDEIRHDEMCHLMCHCSHWFHEMCLIEWLNISDTCPVCRKRNNAITYIDGRQQFIFRDSNKTICERSTFSDAEEESQSQILRAILTDVFDGVMREEYNMRVYEFFSSRLRDIDIYSQDEPHDIVSDYNSDYGDYMTFGNENDYYDDNYTFNDDSGSNEDDGDTRRAK